MAEYTGGYSHTAFERYDDCPKAFAFERMEKLGRVVGAPLDVGRAVHEVLERYGRHCIAKERQQDLDALRSILDATEPQLAPDALADFRGIAERLPEILFEPAVMCEAEFELELAWDSAWHPVEWFDRAARYRAKIDCFHREGAVGCVTDWKTQRKIPPQGEVDRDQQLRTYAWAMSLLHPEIDEWIVRTVYVRYGMAVRRCVLRREDLAGVRDEIERKIARIAGDRKFEPKLGAHCTVCDYAHRCPAFQKLYANDQLPVPTDADTAREAALALIVAQRRAKDLRDRLTAYVEAHGPVDLGDQRFGFVESERVEFPDAKQLGGALQGLGVPSEAIWGALSASKSSVTQALGAAGLRGRARAEALDQLVAKVGRIAPATTLRFYGAGDDE
jgi:hypothetical protein